jgi:hypothetical protein
MTRWLTLALLLRCCATPATADEYGPAHCSVTHETARYTEIRCVVEVAAQSERALYLHWNRAVDIPPVVTHGGGITAHRETRIAPMRMYPEDDDPKAGLTKHVIVHGGAGEVDVLIQGWLAK